ncbi:hypothetical protein Vadar_027117 [Vaccinium darrowii]|uniref:Uncharacterized protein n=1 Tax=Vaccinium darrowii TaxID=229202 RepID=A0ACB7ZEN6_9ERIC|nr:hypothetical protein Vadar_027117 [Vaccinium darrowii]
MYPSWQILFGKDRAIGDLAEDPPEIRDGSDEEIDQGHQESFVDTNDCYTPRFEDGGFVFGDPTFVGLSAGCSQPAYPSTPTSNANPSTPTSHAIANPNASTANPPPKKAKKLTRAEEKHVALSEQLAIYMQENKEVMEKLVVAVGTDQRLSEKRNLVFGMLENLNLEVEDMLTANAMILATDQRVEEFHTICGLFCFSFVDCFATVLWAVLLQFCGLFCCNFVACFAADLWAVLLQFCGLFWYSFVGCFAAILWAVLLQFCGLFCGLLYCSFLGCFAAVLWSILLQFSGLFCCSFVVYFAAVFWAVLLQFCGLFCFNFVGCCAAGLWAVLL